MIKVFIAPRRYVQGAGVLKEIGKYLAPLGKRALVVWGPNVSQLYGKMVSARAWPITRWSFARLSFRVSAIDRSWPVALKR
jgi:hypothetical protein